MAFDDADASPYQPGKMFLGYSDTAREVGITLERHAVTVAGSGAGKGSCLIIPNLLRWPHNALVIDPGGGNVRATWQAREAMGQSVYVIDPARVSGVPDRLQAAFNPLARLDPASRTYGEDLGVIADGLVMRHDPRHARWDDAGRDIIAGLIDLVVSTFPPEHRTLPELRRLLVQQAADLKAMFEAMAEPGRNAPAQDAAALALPDFVEPDGFIKNAQENTKWLGYKSMQDVLDASSCELSELKTKDCTIYLVIDPDYMIEHSRFLRLFVRMAVSAMARGGETGKECLFILDEFFSLGRIDYLQKAAPLMRKNGVHLWPILQSYKQLSDLYGNDGADNFLTNSDALIFFGLDHDWQAAQYVSARLGRFTPSEIEKGIPLWQFGENTAYDRAMRSSGLPHLSPEQIVAMTGKPEGSKVAASMIVLGKGGAKFKLALAPHFEPKRQSISPQPVTVPNHAPPLRQFQDRRKEWAWALRVMARRAACVIVIVLLALFAFPDLWPFWAAAAALSVGFVIVDPNNAPIY